MHREMKGKSQDAAYNQDAAYKRDFTVVVLVVVAVVVGR